MAENQEVGSGLAMIQIEGRRLQKNKLVGKRSKKKLYCQT
jgi:hypothetical protein